MKSSLTCQRNGERVSWDMEQPYCEPKCKQLEKVNNTVVSCSSGSDLGSICTFNCIGEGK